MVVMQSQEMFAVEYQSADGGQTFDIFSSLKKASDFVEKIPLLGKEYKPLFLFKADFNLERIFKDNGCWNYDDYSDTYDLNSVKIIHKFTK